MAASRDCLGVMGWLADTVTGAHATDPMARGWVWKMPRIKRICVTVDLCRGRYPPVIIRYDPQIACLRVYHIYALQKNVSVNSLRIFVSRLGNCIEINNA